MLSANVRGPIPLLICLIIQQFYFSIAFDSIAVLLGHAHRIEDSGATAPREQDGRMAIAREGRA
jgi:hypothetical protein